MSVGSQVAAARARVVEARAGRDLARSAALDVRDRQAAVAALARIDSAEEDVRVAELLRDAAQAQANERVLIVRFSAVPIHHDTVWPTHGAVVDPLSPQDPEAFRRAFRGPGPPGFRGYLWGWCGGGFAMDASCSRCHVVEAPAHLVNLVNPLLDELAADPSQCPSDAVVARFARGNVVWSSGLEGSAQEKYRAGLHFVRAYAAEHLGLTVNHSRLLPHFGAAARSVPSAA